MPDISGILESSLYVADLPRSVSFYQRVFQFPTLYTDHRMCALDAGPAQVVLLFLKGATLHATRTPGGMVPPSDGEGHLHLAFSITPESLEVWERWLPEQQIPIESAVRWPAGGTSVYFRDPDGHLLELATPGLWANY